MKDLPIDAERLAFVMTHEYQRGKMVKTVSFVKPNVAWIETYAAEARGFAKKFAGSTYPIAP